MAKKAAKRGKAKKPTAYSPLARSAFEVLEHGLYHYMRSNSTKDMKFALLHIDQAIELMLKERVRLGGKSVYKNPKETISMYGAYDILDTLPAKIDETLHPREISVQGGEMNH